MSRTSSDCTAYPSAMPSDGSASVNGAIATRSRRASYSALALPGTSVMPTMASMLGRADRSRYLTVRRMRTKALAAIIGPGAVEPVDQRAGWQNGRVPDTVELATRELYALPPEEFMQRRGELAEAARSNGD